MPTQLIMHKQQHVQKFLVAKGGRLPTHGMLPSTYAEKKEPICNEMTEGEVASVHTMVARTF